MKRSGTNPRRNAGLRRTGPPRRRSWIRQRSDKATRVRAAAQPVVDAVLTRDGGCVLRHAGVGDCRGPLTPHHLRKASKGWGWTLDNLITLCASHNGWVEDHPDQAFLVGLVIRDGTTPEGAWVAMRLAGLPVGELVACCPGSGQPTVSIRFGSERCSACRMLPVLEHPADGGGGPVAADHPWSAPV